MKTKPLNVTKFAALKKCSRQIIYDAEKRGELEIDRSFGFPVIYLNKKNLDWQPKPEGRPRKAEP